MSLIAHGGSLGGPLLLGFELAGAVALVALGATVRPGLRRVAAIAAGMTLIVATAPPLHVAADSSATAHMVQHLALTMIAAPLIAAAFAGSSLQRTSIVRRLSRVLIGHAWSPLIAGLVATTTMAVWHLPAAYDTAVDHWWMHGLEHLTMLTTAAWFWATALHHGARRNPVGVIVALSGVAAASAGVGVLLMFAPAELYASQRGVVDGQVAGSLLTASGVLHGAAAFVLVVRALDRLRRPRPVSQATVLSVSFVLAAGVATIASQLRIDVSSPVSATAAAPLQGSDVEPGAEIYRRDCASCHGVAGEGTPRGIAIADRGTSSVYYALATGRMPISDPDAPIERRDSAYTDEQIDQLVAYTANFVSGPGVPAPVDSVSLARGGELYRLHCAACHGATGIGGAQAFSRAAPTLLHATERQTAAAVVAGPGGMPSFRAALDDAQVTSVAEYVDYLQDPVQRGVSIPGGRVGEGLVAWLIGVGALLWFSRWVAGRP